MRSKIIILLLSILLLFFGYHYFKTDSDDTIAYETGLIQKQIKNVSKLVVTEGRFSEVLTYKNKRETYIPGLTFNKKALVVINADVTVSFDLSKIKYTINEQDKIVEIIHIPKEEIKINPDIKYYDTESSTFNEFSGDDHNKINKIAKENLRKKINKSNLKKNAQNRLLSELTKFLVVTNTMGWTLQYNGNIIESESDFKL